MNRARDGENRSDDTLLAARGTAGQLLLCSVLVWRAAPRTVTLLHTHAHTHTVCTSPHADEPAR